MGLIPLGPPTVMTGCSVSGVIVTALRIKKIKLKLAFRSHGRFTFPTASKQLTVSVRRSRPVSSLLYRRCSLLTASAVHSAVQWRGSRMKLLCPSPTQDIPPKQNEPRKTEPSRCDARTTVHQDHLDLVNPTAIAREFVNKSDGRQLVFGDFKRSYSCHRPTC